MHRAVKKNKVIQRYMEALALHTGSQIVHWKDNTSFISVVESKRVNPKVKHIYIPIFFIQEQFDNGVFITKYEKNSVMPEDMCTKPCLVPNISWSTKWISGLRFYPISDT